MNIIGLNAWKAWAKEFPMFAASDAVRISPFQVINAKAKGQAHKILLYGPIGRDWMSNEGIDAAEFVQILSRIPVDEEVHLHIQSPGGNFFEGLSIHNHAKARPNLTTIVDGQAASVAAVILCAGSTVQIPDESNVMIHKSWGMFIGNSDDMDAIKAKLDNVDELQASIFSKKTGKSKAEVMAKMAAETEFNGPNARAFGFGGPVIQAAATTATTPAPLQGAATPNQPPTQGNTMNKNKIVALLKRFGIEAAETESEEQLQAKLDTIQLPAAAVAAPANDHAAQLAKIQARLDKERENNISRQLDQLVLDNKISADEAKEFKPICIADQDDKILATLNKRQPQLPGAAPVAGALVQFGTQGPRDHVMAQKTHRERYEFMKNNWTDLLASGYKNPRQRMIPMAANTTDSALVTDFLVEGTTTFLQNQLASISMFSKQVESDRIKPKATVQNRIITAAGAAQTNATSFEDSTNFVGVEDNRPITMAQITSGGHVTNVERQNGVEMAQWGESKLGEFSDKLASLRNAVILEGTYTATPVVSSAAGFGDDELATLWGQLKKSRVHNIALDGEYYARFLPSDRFDFEVTGFRNRGWDNFVMDTYWTGATANTVGFACNPQAMVCAVGLPLRDPQADMVSRETVIPLPALGISVVLYEWYSNATRTSWATWDIVIGFASLDATAGILIKSA